MLVASKCWKKLAGLDSQHSMAVFVRIGNCLTAQQLHGSVCAVKYITVGGSPWMSHNRYFPHLQVI